MKKESKHSLILMTMMTLSIIGFNTACNKDTVNDNEEEAEEVVQNPTKIVHYDGSAQFVSDLETLIDYSCAVYAMRLAYWKIASNDFKNGEPFVATPNDINANTTSIYDFYDIAATIVEKGDQYEKAFQQLEEEGVLENVNTSSQTRGWISDTFSFIFGLKKSQEVGRKSVLAVIQQSGWENDDNKLQQMFNAVAPGRRQGYTNARQYWSDFSQGKLDATSNQVFQDLYHDADLDFGTNAKELGFSPTGNMTKTAAMLIEKGLSVVIDAAPGGMAGAMTMGKDLYNTYEATEDVVKHTIKGTVTKEEAQRLITQWASNLINYNDKILNNMNGGEWDATIDMWDTPGDFLGQEFANLLLNEPGELLTLDAEKLANVLGTDDVFTVKTQNGQSIDVAIVVDEDGKARIGVKRSDEGSFKVKSDKKKGKKVTAADKKGRRKTTEVKVGEKEVTIDMSEQEENDEPKDGYINFSPPSFTFAPEGGTQRIKLTTNYLYYVVTTSVDDGYWLEANPVQGTDEFTITAQPNNSGEDRTGKVIVKATNKKGKVLKWITITASQKKAEEGVVIKATPSTLEFGPEAGTQQSVITLEGFEYYGGFLDDTAEGWVTLDVGDDLRFTITVAPNNTGEERTGKVIAYGCNVPNPQWEDITMTTILIKQTAAGSFAGEWFTVSSLDGQDPPTPGSQNFFTQGFIFRTDGSYEWREYQCARNGSTNHVSVKDANRRTIKGRYTINGNTLNLKQDSGEYSYGWNTSQQLTMIITNEQNPFESGYQLPFTGQKMELTSTSGEKLVPHTLYQGVWAFEFPETEVPVVDHITVKLRCNTRVVTELSSSDSPSEKTESGYFSFGESEEEASFTQSANGKGLHVVCTTDKDYVDKGEGTIPDYHVSEHLNITLDLDDLSNGITATTITSLDASWSYESYEVDEPQTREKVTKDLRAKNIPYGVGGNSANGCTISHFSAYSLAESLLYDGRIRKTAHTYSLIDDGEWYLDVTISTKAGSKRRTRTFTLPVSAAPSKPATRSKAATGSKPANLMPIPVRYR